MIEVRPFTDGDTTALKAFFARVPEGDRSFFREDVLADGWQSDPTEHRWVAVDGDEIVGSLVIRRGVAWSSHVGDLRIVVDPARRRSGIGRALARLALVEGVGLGLTKLVVEVVAAQEPTVAMFASLGFEAEALLKGHVRDNAGSVHDLFVMAHFVDDTWAAMTTTGIADLVEPGRQSSDGVC
ncbi:MAG TPA: GNAT family N-acetyltransferase [Acidimicrobiales bacterium]|nr:GNAT family N-acetyltransferase [Acidimicrobiales bacterium]